VAGGTGNTASGLSSAVVGGTGNTASGNYATVAGGRQNVASGEHAFAAGRRASAVHSGAFVWSDNQDSEFASTGVNVFMVRASGGMAVNTAPESGVAFKVGGMIKADSVNATTFSVGTLTATTLNGFGTTPLGGIIMWSGSVDAVPAGWALCDGRTSNGRTTPDLRGRFVIGATSGRVVGSVGGSETVTLTTSQLPSHNHLVSGSTADAGTHNHDYDDVYASEAGGPLGNQGWLGHKGNDRDNGPHATRRGTWWAPNHSHSFSVNSQSTGGGQAISILPPFYALAFIMRVQ
jgi:microcystin-dependent protein